MQRNRSQNQVGSPAPNSSTVVTRSRSASSSRTSNTGTSTSGSSSSASSSSSSSSGSGSDSSSSDTEASRASSRHSRVSRTSRSSQKSVSVTPKKSVSNKTATPKKVANSGAAAAGTSNASTNKARTSGSVTNTKTIPRSKAVVKNVRKKNLIASSSESESNVVDSTPDPVIKKVGSKPPATAISVKKPPPPAPPKAAAKRKKPVPIANTQNSNAKANSKKGAAASSNANSKGPKGKTCTAASVHKKLMKSIFSPDNSSEGSDTDSRKPNIVKSKPHATKICNGSSASKFVKKNSSTTVVASAAAKKKAPPTKAGKKSKAKPVLTPTKVATSSSLSSNSSASSSCTSSDSSSDSEPAKKDTEIVKNETEENKKDSSASSGGSEKRKRPVTRRQRRTVKSKTIPTTTVFNQSALTKTQSQISTCWDSDFSDEPKSLARVPTKSAQKVRVKPTEEDEEAFERERKCPFPCCDSHGHLSGKFPTHSMLPTCPKYHGFTPEECKENADERMKREVERKKYYVANQPHYKKPSKLPQEAKNWLGKVKELKAVDTIDGLCSQYDLSLWNDALALAAGRIETEQGEGISFRSVAMGRWEMSCWCESPYPEPLCHCRRLFICEFCLKPVQSGTVLRRHCAKCVWRHPPGDEIYRKERLSVWEVDGKSQKTYCQNLCLLAKCFLDHKTLYLDVDPFLFYVMTLADSTGCHIVGYFSKEKNQSFLNYNVSCILTLPPYQRQGFGRLLIEFSYLLTRVEGKVGSPEKPLSDLGLISYRSYWKDAVLRRMCACATGEMNVKDLSIELGVTSADLISTLQFLGMLKYWKGKHLVLKKQDVLEEYLERVRRRGEQRAIDSSCLRWRPYQPPPEAQS